MSVYLSPVGGAAGQFFDGNGDPLAGGKLYTYAAGTTTPLTTYTSVTGLTSNPNPIILNSGGRVPSEIWLSEGLEYKFVLQTSLNILIGTWDNITGINDPQSALDVPFTGFKGQVGTVEDLADDDGSDWIGYQPSGSGAVARSAQDKLRETVSVMDFGATGDGVTDDTATIQAAVDAVSNAGGGILFFPEGTYLLKGKNTPISNDSRLVDGVTLKSNVTFQGVGNASVIKVDTNCANGFTGRFRTAATVGTNLTNIQFRNMQFTRAATTFFEQQYQLWFDTGTNIVVDSCTFTGWSGDAIIIGNILNSTTSAWLQSICDNIKITNCVFDGVNKDNRNAISVFSGTNIEIAGNFFKNTSRSDMPGAIDLEPELVTNVIENISIHDNTFTNIGGSVGVIGCALFANLTTRAQNIYIYDNLIENCTNTYALFCQGIETDTSDIAANAPKNITFQNNDIQNMPNRMFAVGGIADCNIIGNSFQGQTSTALLAFTATAGKFLNNVNFQLNNNMFVDCHTISTDVYTPLIGIFGEHGGGSFAGNVFISSGRWSDVSTPASIEVLGFMNATSLLSTYITIVNNTVTTNGLAYSTSIPPFFASGTFSSPTTIAAVNNKFLGYAETGDAFSVQTQANTAITNGSVSYQNLAAAPSTPKAGDVYYNSTTNKLQAWNGTIWNDLF